MPGTDTSPEAAKNDAEWHRAWIGLGSNIGHRRDAIRRALRLLDQREGCRVIATSPMYETKARIVEDQPDFINACAELETRRSPDALMSLLLDVETQMGRDRSQTEDKGPRTIDLDLLVYEDRIIDQPGLTVPHPGLRERPFVLHPLADIAPDLAVPPDGETVRELAEGCG